ALANPFNPISWTIASIVSGASVIGLLIGVHPALAILPVLGVPSIVVMLFSERAFDDLRERQAEPSRRMRHLLELTTEAAAAKEIRIFGLAGELVSRRQALFDELERARFRLVARQAAKMLIGWLIFGAGYLAGVALAVHLA